MNRSENHQRLVDAVFSDNASAEAARSTALAAALAATRRRRLGRTAVRSLTGLAALVAAVAWLVPSRRPEPLSHTSATPSGGSVLNPEGFLIVRTPTSPALNPFIITTRSSGVNRLATVRTSDSQNPPATVVSDEILLDLARVDNPDRPVVLVRHPGRSRLVFLSHPGG